MGAGLRELGRTFHDQKTSRACRFPRFSAVRPRLSDEPTKKDAHFSTDRTSYLGATGL
jgi:hypothetical protein